MGVSESGEVADNLLLEILDLLEEYGVGPDEFSLHRHVDLEALHRLVESGSDVMVEFSVNGVHLRVTQHKVTVTE